MKKSIKIPILARVEGEGALELEIKNNKIDKLNLKIYEPPRLFEKFLEGREYNDVIDIVARICGICPVAYQMSAAHAIEDCFELKTSPWIRAMRRVFYCGEWIESHCIHIHFLAAPDFLGFNTAPEMAKKFPEEVRRGIRLQTLGHELINLFGGRPVHPIGACVGGFYHAPKPEQVTNLINKLKNGLEDAENLLNWTASLALPDSSHDFIYVALQHSDEYPFNEGNITTSSGLSITAAEYKDHFQEKQVAYSTALHSSLDGKDYLVGPLARLNLNHQHLPEPIKKILAENKIKIPSQNMFHSIIARAVEVYYSLLEAISLLEDYQYPDAASMKVKPKAGVGYAATEAPRGLLWQHYAMDNKGLVKIADIIPPTSQNQFRMESDLKIALTKFGLDKEDDLLRNHCEQIIRNYDPCISCSTHFLDLRVKRS